MQSHMGYHEPAWLKGQPCHAAVGPGGPAATRLASLFNPGGDRFTERAVIDALGSVC